MRANLMLQDEKYKFAVMIVLLGFSFFLVYYFHFIMGTKIIFTHFFYIPIILSAIWWKRKALIVPLVLAAALLLSNILILDFGGSFIEDLFRAAMFIFVGTIVIFLAEEIEKSRRTLTESEEKFRNVFNNANDMITLSKLNDDGTPGKFIEVNDVACEKLGYSKEEFLKMTPRDIGIPGQVDKSKIYELLKKGKATFERTHVTKEGQKIPVEINSHIFTLKGEKVALSIVRDISERKKAENALKESEEKFRELFNSADDMITLNVINEDGLPGKFIEVNEVACERLGYTKDELLNMGPIDIVAKEKISEMPENARKLDKEGHATFEIIHLTKDGEKIPVEVNNHLFIMKGKKVALAISRDITERKKAEEQLRHSLEEKEMLMKEIHHRVKNNLMVISSLLNLQSKYIKDKESLNIFKESQSRAKSMALIHERLYRSDDMKKINFGEYIETLSNDLYHTYVTDQGRITLNLEVEDAKIDINTSVPLGLIVNELVSNCMKHAFPANEMNGEISITFKKIGDKFMLNVKDNGVGFPEDLDFKNTDSLGLQLVTMLVDQIDGEIELKNKDGTEFKITFKEIYSK
jgi:PAS domain S-box-containing protein